MHMLQRKLYASLGRRLAAYLLDLVIATSVVFLVGPCLRIFRAVGVWVPAGAGATPSEIYNALGFVPKLFVVFAFVLSTGPVYFALCEASAWQATFGKRFLNVYVTDDDGKRISTARSFGREIVKSIFLFPILFLINVIAIAWSKNGKCLYDSAAKTLVLRGRPMPGGAIEPWRIAAGLGLPFVWILGTFLVII
jgi:uncharacterized RDD family membrane protein YckC